ncbi:MAG: carboxypeptidase-like regulatory domain-containing protein, partial [Bacteroidota bacterium]|nr:carboxypeptidase-like regulatory domain-containing protein [Bacteroidota bacterium]
MSKINSYMRRVGIFLLMMMWPAALIYSQIKISGTVKDTRGRNIDAVSITLKGTYDGTISDSTGHFSFKTFEKGNFMLEAKILGYKIVEHPVSINKESIEINFSLKEEVTELKAVSVTAGSFEAGDKKRAATVLSSLDIYTTGGANADITATVKT